MIYDVVIIGAGPGGATLARLLNKKLKVLILDKRNLSAETDFNKGKCCGGLLAPDAQKVLAKLGLGLPKNVLVGPQMFSVRAEDFDNNLQKYYQRHYINVNREGFDRWLFNLIPPHVDILTETIFNHYTTTKNGIEVHITNNKKQQIIQTKYLVGADGATSKVRRLAFKNEPQPERYLSIQHWFKTEKELPHYVSIFDREITDFYSWIIQKDGHTIVGSALKEHKDVNNKFHHLVKKLNIHGYKLNELVKSEGTWIMRTRKLNQINLTNGNVALIGEAAGFISPSSAEGISYALRSGEALAESLNHSLANYSHLYYKKTIKLKLNLIIKNIKVIAMYQRFIRLMIMKSGILSMKVNDADL